MKPYVICYMTPGVDQRIFPNHRRPLIEKREAGERLPIAPEWDAWLVGQVTGQEFALRDASYPPYTGAPLPRENWFAQKEANAWAVVLDANGEIAWGRSEVDGSLLVVVLTQAVADSHLAGLRADGVSYIFAGEREINLEGALETLHRDLGIRCLLVDSGDVIKDALLLAGLVDEISLFIAPTPGSNPPVFDIHGAMAALSDCVKSVNGMH
ncbi:MAG: 2-hydroxy-3-oxopropionate reductase [Chloroflexota bacterium]|nr:dihydrofolate reductase family protein [Caldilinea sp.]GIK71273.1 MAG: 2-hydroxy-3-oxopropionate reductase [Chloroflexota bacterium]